MSFLCQNCEKAIFTNVVIDFQHCHQIFCQYTRLTAMAKVMHIVAAIFKINTPLLSLIILFHKLYRDGNRFQIGLWFFANKNLVTERTSQVVGFSDALHILINHSEISKRDTDRP